MNRLLLVEDDPVDQLFVKKAFEDFKDDLEIDIVRDGREALENLDAKGAPALILIDLNMPGMTGQELLESLMASERHKLVPSIVLSTSENKDDVRKCYERAANAYVVKPETPEAYRRVANAIYDFWIEEVTCAKPSD